MLQDRPAAKPTSSSEAKTNVVVRPFVRLFTMARMLKSKYPFIRLYIFSLVFSNSALTSVVTLATTFLTFQLKLSSTLIAIVFALALIIAVPSSIFFSWVAKKLPNHCKWVLVCINLGWFFSLGLAALLLRTEKDANMIWVFATIWGVLFGGIYTIQNGFFASIIPGGNEAEYVERAWMGVGKGGTGFLLDEWLGVFFPLFHPRHHIQLHRD